MQSSDYFQAVSDWFTSGPISKKEEFSYRAEQHQLALLIAETLQQNDMLIAEAGTGIGKTLAYLIPTLLQDKKIVISTGTKHLQDQILNKDIPQLRELMPVTKQIALLKGRANYLCLYRADNLTIDDDFFSEDKLHDLTTVKSWTHKLNTGDIAEIPDIADDAEIWPWVTSTTDNCLGKDCPYFDNCYLVKARRKALQADILVINHHLFFADLVMREEGFGEILPSFQAVIFDEAHQIPEIAANFFGERFSSRQINYLIQDTMRAVKSYAVDAQDIAETCNQLRRTVDDAVLVMKLFPSRGDFQEIKDDRRLSKCLQLIDELMTQFTEQIELLTERHQFFDHLLQRAIKQRQQWRLMDKVEDKVIYWYEVFRKSFVIHQTPLDVAGRLQPTFSQQRAWIFTSATLTVNQSVKHFQTAMGINDAKVAVLASPFDFKKQSMMYIPTHLPDPREDDYIPSLVKAAIPVIQAVRGRTFFLVTSYRALDRVESLLMGEIDHPILCQGKMAKHSLLKKFIELGDAVLIGTTSFWEGVDVKGQALSCVIIDKLPFASPGDPITKAKLKHYRERGVDPFQEYQLPKAVLQLRQGIGRLIRDTQDVGILMIGDHRLIHKPYGKIFWQSLPDMPVTRRFSRVEQFLQHDKIISV